MSCRARVLIRGGASGASITAEGASPESSTARTSACRTKPRPANCEGSKWCSATRRRATGLNRAFEAEGAGGLSTTPAGLGAAAERAAAGDGSAKFGVSPT